MKKTIGLTILLLQAFWGSSQIVVELETGLPFPGYNEVRIPNETGTTFDFNRDFALKGAVVPLRIYLRYSFMERNHFHLLFAPLSLQYQGSAPRDIRFQSTLFPEGTFMDGLYKFNSYRLGYRRDVYITDQWKLGVGFTAKIRDARVRLSGGETSDAKNDLGFVPLLHLYAAYNTNRLTFYFEGDGLAGGPGRAFDIFLGGKYSLADDRFFVKTGYRLLEGGADVSEVYNFTLINFLSLGMGATF